jgi:hypothetical protein
MTAEEQDQLHPDPLPEYQERGKELQPLEYHQPSMSPYDRPVSPTLPATIRRVRRIMLGVTLLVAIILIVASARKMLDVWDRLSHLPHK